MRFLLLTMLLTLAASPVHADEEGVVFTMGAERFVLTPACAQRVDHALTENDLMHLRFDMPETPQCFGAFHDLLSSHLGDRLVVIFRGETLLEADLHTPLGPRNIVLVMRHRRLALDAARYIGGWPRPDAP